MAGNQEAFKRLMDRGNSAAWDTSWEQAAGFYRQALEEIPDHPQALSSLGMALIELGEYAEAIKYYKLAAVKTPEDPMPLEKLGKLYEQQGDLSEAVRMMMQAAELYLKGRDVEKAVQNWVYVCSLQPEHLMAHTRLAMIYDRLGKKPEAVKEYLATASLMQMSGDIAKSIQVVEYCLQIVPNSLEARQALGLLHTNQPLPKPARPKKSGGLPPRPETSAPPDARQLQAPVQKAKQMDPVAEARQKAISRLADLLFTQAEETAEPSGVVRRSLGSLTRGTGILSNEQADRTRILLHLGQAIDSQMQGADARAAEDLEHAINIGLQDSAAHFDLGMLLIRKDAQRALRYLQRSAKNSEYALASNLLMGQIFLENNQLAEASSAYLQALCMADMQTVSADQADELRQLYEPLIEVQMQQSDQESLRKMCQTVQSQLMRNDWREYFGMARRQLPVQPEGSPPLPLAEMLLETSSSQVVEALAHIRMLASQNKINSAMEEVYYALEYSPTYLPLHVQIADLMLQEGRTQEAIQKFLLVAELYGLRGETAQAVRLLNRVIQMVPMDLSVRSRMIDLLVVAERYDEAVKQYVDLADIYYQLAEFDMARQTYAAALRLAQKSKRSRAWAVQILGKMADIDLQRLDLRQALKTFEQMRTIEPNDPDTRAQLIDLFLRLGQVQPAVAEAESFTVMLDNSGKRTQAIEFLHRVIQEHPDRFELRKRLADLYILIGQVDRAVQELDGAADALLSAGNREGAISILQAIIGLNPPNVAEYRAALVKLTQR